MLRAEGRRERGARRTEVEVNLESQSNGIDVMGVLVAGRRARDREGRRMEVKVNPKR